MWSLYRMVMKPSNWQRSKVAGNCGLWWTLGERGEVRGMLVAR